MPRCSAWPRSTALLAILGVYVLASFAAAATVAVLPSTASEIWLLGVASLAGMLAVFACSVIFDNSSVFDAYWSVAPIVTMPWLLLRAPVVSARAWLVTGIVLAWGARLTWNWVRQWRGMGHEDFRYVDIRQKTGRAYWLVSFAGIHAFPAVLVWAGSVPLTTATTSTRPLGLFDLIGAAIAIGATVLEGVADQQLRSFVAVPHPPGSICDSGLWSWSRHPNYLGEVLFWWGLFIIGWAADPGAWLTGAGAIAITLLFNVVSIPLLERRMAARRPGYPEHRRRVSRLLLWPPSGRAR